METAAQRKLPKIKTIRKWKETYAWLDLVKHTTTDGNTQMKMICKVCISEKSKIELMQTYSDTFINGSTNYRISALEDHAKSDCHKKAVNEQEESQAKASGAKTPLRKVVHTLPKDAPIQKGLSQMEKTEHEALVKLFHIAYYIALKGHAFTDFRDMIELEKLHKVKFQASTYENETACRNFINSVADYLFETTVAEKLKRVNFIAILCDGATDQSMTEQRSYMFRDPDTLLPVLKFFNIATPELSQDAVGLKEAIKNAFKEKNLESVLDKMVFLSSDGASINSGKKSGLIRMFQEDYEWICFIWCFSHRLELALKDSLEEFFDPVDESLRHLYYLYKNSSKKLHELKNLYPLLKDQYEMYGAGVKPDKATGTRWIDHKLRATQKVVDKYGLYTQHLRNVIADTSKQTDRATLEGKFKKLIDASVLLRGAASLLTF